METEIPHRSEPLIDKFGRTYEQLCAEGKKIIPRLNKVTRLFMPRGGRHKTKMETPTTPTPPALADATSTAAPTPPGAPGAAVPPAEAAPKFDDIAAALKSAPAADSPAGAPTAESLADELKHIDDNTSAETIIGIIQTGLMLIGEEEGILSDVEKKVIRRPLVRVLAKYNVGADAMPPEADLALAMLGLFVARLQKPKTATAWVKFKAWFMNKAFQSKGRQLAQRIGAEVGGRPHE